MRMVVPMRREFGRQLDVQRFLRELEYAREVIEQALTTQDARLLQYAAYMQQHQLGLRDASPLTSSAPTENAPAPTGASETVEVPLSASPTAAEMRERVLRKYTSGLR
ncbi:MAG TPA: hypothetical protein VIY30_11535 [Burkholderiaceae bacterium]